MSSFSSLLEECSRVLPPSFPLNLYAALSALRAHSVSRSPHRSQSKVCAPRRAHAASSCLYARKPLGARIPARFWDTEATSDFFFPTWP